MSSKRAQNDLIDVLVDSFAGSTSCERHTEEALQTMALASIALSLDSIFGELRQINSNLDEVHGSIRREGNSIMLEVESAGRDICESIGELAHTTK